MDTVLSMRAQVSKLK